MAEYDTSTPFGAYLAANPNSQDAYDYLSALFKSYGVDMDQPVKDIMVQGITNTDAVQQRLEATPQFAAAFPEVAALKAKGMAPMKPGDIINQRQGYKNALTAVGIAPDFLSQDQVTQMIVNGKSPVELQAQIANTITKVTTDPTLAPQLNRLYGFGMTSGEIAAHFLDPDHTEAYFEKQVNAAAVAARSSATGFGDLNQTQAEHLAGLGISDAQAATGFGNLAAQNPLFQQNASEGTSISKDVGIGAQFDQNAADQALLTQRRAERQASFSGGGNFADPNKSGLTGAGASNT